MSETLMRLDPIPTEPFSANLVTVRAAPPMARFSLRARTAGEVGRLLGEDVPDKIGGMAQGLACLGPDEWLLLAPAGRGCPSDATGAVAVTDVSDRNIGLTLEGARAAAILATGCPLDLDHFAVGRVTRTLYETVEIILVREAEDRFHIEVWRSFAPWLWLALTTAASE